MNLNDAEKKMRLSLELLRNAMQEVQSQSSGSQALRMANRMLSDAEKKLQAVHDHVQDQLSTGVTKL